MDRAREQTGHVDAASYHAGKNVGGWSPESQNTEAELNRKAADIDSTQKERVADNERHLRDDLTIPGETRRNFNEGDKNSPAPGYGIGGMMSSPSHKPKSK